MTNLIGVMATENSELPSQDYSSFLNISKYENSCFIFE